MKWYVIAGLVLINFTIINPDAEAKRKFTCPSKAGQILLCHIPPGNPSEKHNIAVGSENAKETHISQHGDTEGLCPGTTYADLKGFCGICDVDVDSTCQ